MLCVADSLSTWMHFSSICSSIYFLCLSYYTQTKWLYYMDSEILLEQLLWWWIIHCIEFSIAIKIKCVKVKHFHTVKYLYFIETWNRFTGIPIVYGDNYYASTCLLGVHGIDDIEHSNFCRSYSVFLVWFFRCISYPTFWICKVAWWLSMSVMSHFSSDQISQNYFTWEHNKYFITVPIISQFHYR
jgi:hypothetical protein